MGLILIVFYLIFVFVVLVIFGFICKQNSNTLQKFFIISSGFLVALSPIIFLYGRDYLIAKELNQYCENNNGTVVVSSIGERIVEFNSKVESGESRELWKTLFNHPKKSVILNIKRNGLVKEPGRYIFRAMDRAAPECTDYNNYIESLWPKSKERIKREFYEFSNLCIGISNYQPTENIIHIEYKVEYSLLSRNPFYSIHERRVSLVDKSGGMELVFSIKPTVNRSFKLFETKEVFEFPISCSTPNTQSKFLLLSHIYK